MPLQYEHFNGSYTRDVAKVIYWGGRVNIWIFPTKNKSELIKSRTKDQKNTGLHLLMI